MADPAGADTVAEAVLDRWETPQHQAMPVLHLAGFDGPMDLLLDLAERQRIDLGGLSMVALAEQFVAATERLAATVPIEQRAGWLVLATRLVLLRARLLLAAGPDAAAAERDAAAELRRLDAVAFVRAAAAWLEARPLLGRDIFGRAQPAPPRREGGYVALMEACLAVLRGRAGQPGEAVQVYRPVVADLWRVPDALARIRAVLAEHPEGGEMERFLVPVAADEPHWPLKARAVVASTLVAGLELARAGSAELTQGEAFGVIYLGAAAIGNEERQRAR